MCEGEGGADVGCGLTWHIVSRVWLCAPRGYEYENEMCDSYDIDRETQVYLGELAYCM